MQENRMFNEMRKAAKAWLVGRDPMEIAQRAGVAFDGAQFYLECLGRPLCVAYPSYVVFPETEPWQELLLLHYLHLADGTPLAGEWIGFGEHKDGLIRGGSFERKVEQVVRRSLGKLPVETLHRRCAALGAREKPSNADFCAEIPVFPRYPVLLKLWFPDEEFEASGRLLLDRSAAHYLSIEDAVMLGELILERLESEQTGRPL